MDTSVPAIDKFFRLKNAPPKSLAAVALGFVALLAGLAGCHGPVTLGEGAPTLQLSSSSFAAGDIQKNFTCDGADISPELVWTAPPPETQSFALLVIDRDALVGSFVHWIIYDLPAAARGIPQGLPKQAELPDGSRQGQNDFDKIGYGGPCPPGKSVHHYVFALYALDSKLNLPAGASRKQVETALQPHILAHGELIAKYHR